MKTKLITEICGDKPPTIKLPPRTVAAYIKMNGRTYYIDDSTAEAIVESWANGDKAREA